MELVYLWVEDYKNIHKQGFNFSPRFECKYDDVKNELTIKKNNDYIENFFGENINITAIVGKNGSGKSSVFKFIKLAVEVFLSQKEYPCFEYFEVENFENPYILIFEQENIFYNVSMNITTEMQETFRKNNIDNSREDSLLDNYDLHTFKTDSFPLESILNSISFSKKINNFFNPNLIVIDFSDWFSPETQSFLLKDYLNFIIDISFKKIQNTKNINKKEDLALSEFIKKNKNILKKDIIVELENLLVIQNYINQNTLDDFAGRGETCYELNLSKKLNNRLIKFLLALNTFISINIFDKNKKEKHPDGIMGIFQIGMSYNSLSNGEKHLLSILLSINTFVYNKNRDDNIIIFLDEPDNELHPEWQRTIITELINSCKSNPNIHIILTSHSPFLLSDLPKQNIIFLDKDENGNCKVKDGLKEKKQTFGANIHTLLSDSFFMEDGLMGEFAKSKINEIKSFYELSQKLKERISKNLRTKELAKKSYMKRKKRFEQVQEIIGEPFLQRVIKNYLDELELLFSDDNTLIEKELADIEKRKAYLESLKNA